MMGQSHSSPARILHIDGISDRHPKTCSNCNRAKSREHDFGRSANASDGLKSQCRQCERNAEYARYHEGGGKQRVAARNATPATKARRKATAIAYQGKKRVINKAYQQSPRGKLMCGRTNARQRLKRATSEERKAALRDLIAMYDREILRLERIRDAELPLEPRLSSGALCDYRGVFRTGAGNFEVRISVPGQKQVGGGTFATIEEAREVANALAWDHMKVRDYSVAKRLREGRAS